MVEHSNLREMSNTLLAIRHEIDKLKVLGGDFKFVEMNITRMSAMLKMLELGISDLNEVLNT